MSAILNSVYNNYLTAYAPKSVTQYDTHKKSELRSVYNSIVKINKESPWYLPTTSRSTQEYAVALKEHARELHNTIASLGGLEETGLFNKKSAFSTHEDIVSANYINTQDGEGVDPQFQIKVNSLASPQENVGEYLPNDKISLPAGTYSFDVAINDINYEFQFSINESETNRKVQERLVRLINQSDIGIKASLIETEDAIASLHLISDISGLPTGKEVIFSISEEHTSMQKGAVAYLGLNHITQKASDAHFQINGEDHSSSSNLFTISNLFEVELKGISPDDVSTTIGLKPDLESLTDNVSHLLGGYNSFIKAAASYLETQRRSKQLLQEMTGIASLYQDSLASTGVHLREDGTMEINPTQLYKTVSDSEDLHQSFGYLKDFSNMLLNKSKQVSLNPMSYVEKTIVAYKNPGHNFISPYISSAYSGMMFNSYC